LETDMSTTTYERLCQILISEHRLTADRLQPDAPLESLGIDSLATVELLWNVETAFAIKMPMQPPPLVTLADVTQWVDSLVALQGGADVRRAA